MKRVVLPVALAAVIGAAVLVAIPASGGPFRGAERTPTMTPDELSDYSDRRNELDLAENLAIARRLIDSGESVTNVPRGETEGFRYDRPLALDAALSEANHLLVGVVEDQILNGSDTDPEAVFLVSIIVDDEGSEIGRFVQRTAIARPASGGIALSYGGTGSKLLTAGRHYALPCTGEDSGCQAIWRHIYEVDGNGNVQPFSEFVGVEKIRGRPLAELEAMWRAKRSE